SVKPVKNDRRQMQHDEAEDDVEPQLVNVAGLVRNIDADEARQRTGVNAVFVFGDEAEPDLDRDGDEQGDDAERAERVMTDAIPTAPQIGGDGPRTADEARPARGRATDETP